MLSIVTAFDVKSCRSDSIFFYTSLMEEDNNSIETEYDLRQRHYKAKASALEKFRKECSQIHFPGTEYFTVDLKNELEECYEEHKELLEMRLEEKMAVQGLLSEAGKRYHEEMLKHFQNDDLISPEDVKLLHSQARNVIIKSCKAKSPLGEGQEEKLVEYLDMLKNRYVRKAKMNKNLRENGVAIGIDLGTTYCCVAVYYKGKVIIIPNNEDANSLTTPSYVKYENDFTYKIGKVAKRQAHTSPENTIYDVKRIIGRKMDDEKLRSDMEYWPFAVVEDEGVPKIKVNDRLYHPEQISGMLLAKLKRMAETYLKLEKGSIKKAVITVPAYFDDGQRQATVDAGKLAGLEVLTILNEPTAAAIAYSLERYDTGSGKILIYDLGGGTFDVAVLDMNPSSIEVLGVNGDTHLGGEDFDKRLINYCIEYFEKQTGINLLHGLDSGVKLEREKARRRLRRLHTYCEEAKVDLSNARTTAIEVDEIIEGRDLLIEVTREKFEELNQADFERSIELIAKTLDELGMQRGVINDIVLVGGSSIIPKVQELVSNYFEGKKLNNSIHPDHAIAYGAAIQAALMNGERGRWKRIQDVTPMPLGIRLDSGELSVIIPKNSKVPARETDSFSTSRDNMTGMTIMIYQGEDLAEAENNKLLGTFRLEGIPAGKEGEHEIHVCMEINEMGILHVDAICLSNGVRSSLRVMEDKQRLNLENIRDILDEEA